MKKLLPTSTPLSVNQTKGFTLIELLVVIAIIAILSVIGVALFTSTQSKARDSKRVQDIISMSKGMEVNYVTGTGYPASVSSTWFADGAIPTNPSPGGSAYNTTTLNSVNYTFCANLENSTGNATGGTGTNLGTTGGSWFCRKNSQ